MMQETHLHLVAFDVPYPPDYGGVIDVYYKIKALNSLGIKIHLHCFQYGRNPSEILESLCYKVNYYPRKKGLLYQISLIPFIINTRKSELLITELLKDTHPILFEGMHCCYYLTDSRLKDRVKLVRTHNIEHKYYLHLAKAEINFIRKLYYITEATKLKIFERKLIRASALLAISKADVAYYRFLVKNTHLISAFHPDTSVNGMPGRGNFAFYHGNLEIGENNEAALYLVNEVFKQTQLPLIIAGKNPSQRLKDAVQQHSNVKLIANCSTEKIYEYIRQAHINVLPTFQATGIKLKLLAALFNGRHCVVNSPMIAGTGLEGLCHICDSAPVMQQKITTLFNEEFNITQLEMRNQLLQELFSTQKTALKIVELIRSL